MSPYVSGQGVISNCLAILFGPFSEPNTSLVHMRRFGGVRGTQCREAAEEQVQAAAELGRAGKSAVCTAGWMEGSRKEQEFLAWRKDTPWGSLREV